MHGAIHEACANDKIVNLRLLLKSMALLRQGDKLSCTTHQLYTAAFKIVNKDPDWTAQISKYIRIPEALCCTSMSLARTAHKCESYKGPLPEEYRKGRNTYPTGAYQAITLPSVEHSVRIRNIQEILTPIYCYNLSPPSFREYSAQSACIRFANLIACHDCSAFLGRAPRS